MKYRTDKSLQEIADLLTQVIISFVNRLRRSVRNNNIVFINAFVKNRLIYPQEVTSIDTLMKNKLASYSQVKSNLQGLQRKET